MADNKNTNVFRRLTQLFRSGPVIKRKVRDFDSSTKTSSAFELFRKTQSHVYSTAMSAYGTYDRMARYSDFSEMEYTPEISSAIDIYSEESVSADEHGKVLHVYSENSQIPTNSVLFVTPSSTKNQRHIQKSEFLKVWEEAKQITDPFSPSNYTLSTRNSSYIVTLMRHFVSSEKIE